MNKFYVAFEMELAQFRDRVRELRAIIRFKLYRLMFYRTDDELHSRRVAARIREANPLAVKVYGSAYDPLFAFIEALLHDDIERYKKLDDVQSVCKMEMSPEEEAALTALEDEAMEWLLSLLPATICGYSVRELVQGARDLTRIESQVVKVVGDWGDAMGESCHEVFAGNIEFVSPQYCEHCLRMHDRLPPYGYQERLTRAGTKFPRLVPLLEAAKTQPRSVMHLPEPADFIAIARHGKPHTEESIYQPTGYVFYDVWRETCLKYGTKRDIQRLFNQREFPLAS